MHSGALGLLLRPLTDLVAGLDRCFSAGSRQVLLALAGLALAWWVYVPAHELLHAAACVAAGGTVSKLEVSALYGGELLARVFPFVDPTGNRPGRLSGFDTAGSDLVYLATDLGPYVLTLFPGVWLLRLGACSGRGLLLGAALPLAWAPFFALGGDAYEIGSILATRLPPWAAPAMQDLLRSDDVFLVLTRIREVPGARPWLGAACAFVLGTVWALATYLAGSAVARGLGRPGAEPVRRSSPLRGGAWPGRGRGEDA